MKVFVLVVQCFFRVVGYRQKPHHFTKQKFRYGHFDQTLKYARLATYI